ncbi:type II toxin-antitoxin system RelE/ParE family toxin [Erythrobacter sp. SCSIO 43205]|uniref:type II toxin-antitoxin system RelE/ParE family toxin n=1 Tax=Erythrobacter sp. SCSIO 43205 TaxID=2779361 RepID=UPI001CAA16B5|nr:type II toxin-antitoxin system RelE/ParE family toxin [Erythrobacter sp. SCSIO 43205]UAB79029.1 type II toxin-antitoxin system RelE/ParE family toxin [Erythrobacter sp. SCSIO 43205]
MAKPLARVELTFGAERDLAGIWRRRRDQRGIDSDDGADALLDKLISDIESLADHPEKGPVPQELEALGINDFRQLSRSPFLIIYRYRDKPTPGCATVFVVADARRDFRTLLEERLLGDRRG